MAIKPIDELCLFVYLKSVESSFEGRTGKPDFPMLALMKGNDLLAAIKIGLGNAWHVENVVAEDKYGPTIYKALMELSGSKGIAPAYKYRKERKDFVVPKSKNIWKEFSECSDVSYIFLCDKYKEDFLNNTYISKVDELNISGAEKNLKDKIRKDFIESITIKDKVNSFFKSCNMNLKYRKHIYTYHRNIATAVKDLLNDSVLVHQK
ncbi:hypothetical protein [Vibrio echinoideorum]|uniref:hypothetical protein n=1 Tax=Vibrio echinoideorum TaxID=2100116 RepID=UPI00355349A6